jgi:hypothetical protein
LYYARISRRIRRRRSISGDENDHDSRTTKKRRWDHGQLTNDNVKEEEEEEEDDDDDDEHSDDEVYNTTQITIKIAAISTLSAMTNEGGDKGGYESWSEGNWCCVVTFSSFTSRRDSRKWVDHQLQGIGKHNEEYTADDDDDDDVVLSTQSKDKQEKVLTITYM